MNIGLHLPAVILLCKVKADEALISFRCFHASSSEGAGLKRAAQSSWALLLSAANTSLPQAVTAIAGGLITSIQSSSHKTFDVSIKWS